MSTRTAAETDLLITEHLHLVGHIVRQLATRYPRHVDRGELASAGALGLVEAAHRYDASTGVPFARFAALRIRGAVIDCTRTRDWAPRGVRRRAREITVTTDELTRRHGTTPSDDDIAVELGVDTAELRRRVTAVQTATLLHLDAQLSASDDDAQATLVERVEETDPDVLPHHPVEPQELVGAVRLAVDHLPPTQREVLRRSYFDGHLLRDIAASLGVTEARVSQIRAEALNAVRAWFAATNEDVPPVPDDAPGRRSRTVYVDELRVTGTWRACMAAAHTDGRLAATA